MQGHGKKSRLPKFLLLAASMTVIAAVVMVPFVVFVGLFHKVPEGFPFVMVSTLKSAVIGVAAALQRTEIVLIESL